MSISTLRRRLLSRMSILWRSEVADMPRNMHDFAQPATRILILFGFRNTEQAIQTAVLAIFLSFARRRFCPKAMLRRAAALNRLRVRLDLGVA